MPEKLDRIQYYGRGPIKSYAYRKESADIGLYNQTVIHQFHPYIRPQETGTKSDVRYWEQMDKSGKGLEFRSSSPFYASALNYSIEALVGGQYKQKTHSEEVKKADYVNVLLDGYQAGVATVNSWGALPLPQYQLPYRDYSFSILISPLK